MEDNVIKVTDLWKRYDIHPIHTLWGKGSRLLRRLRGKKSAEEPFWALRDLNFEVKRGEALGVIGPNGAGKSTLLKILCGVTNPTRGKIETRGRVAPLIELGAGFHPELTGRENIFINGAILGMSLSEIRRKFDDIVSFSGLGEFIDTPVKKYSSGMYVRLGFSVAISTEPDILLIDEVLAVGDARFKASCFQAIRELRNSGCSLILVSHDRGQIMNMCDRALLLDHGRNKALGSPQEIVSIYESGGMDFGVRSFEGAIKTDSGTIRLISIKAFNLDNPNENPRTRDAFELNMRYRAEKPLENPSFGISISSESGELVYGTNTRLSGFEIDIFNGEYTISFRSTSLILMPGSYYVTVAVTDDSGFQHYWHERALSFSVSRGAPGVGCAFMEHEWSCQEAAHE